MGDSMTSGEFRMELSDDLLEHNLVRYPQYKEIRIPEDHKEIGNRVWDGAVVFTRWLEESLRRKYIEHQDNEWWCLDVKNKRLLEIGAGTGTGFVHRRKVCDNNGYSITCRYSWDYSSSTWCQNRCLHRSSTRHYHS
eukprot:gb/GECG01012292.1/.p1 GENE.gb/GECG01012292.1/~~gb/GECG01012292.1/.p1  ORF type:complete len:137 (+),score=11.00 gb/GECG01012292.1/:1-411(+)